MTKSVKIRLTDKTTRHDDALMMMRRSGVAFEDFKFVGKNCVKIDLSDEVYAKIKEEIAEEEISMTGFFRRILDLAAHSKLK